MWTCDTGGFLSPTNNESCPYNLYHNDCTEHAELYERWVQFSCFTPIFRTHHAGGEAVPFRYNEMTLDGMSHYIKLRYRLIPYVYSLYYENHLHGTPIMRPLFWHYPDDKRAYEIKDEYLFGENMLIAPVLESQKNFRKVYFSQGKWYDFDYDYLYEGGREYEVYAPQNRIPVFVRAWGIIPMSKDILNTREMDFKALELLIYPESDSDCFIYADDGITDSYLNGNYTVTKVTCHEDANSLKIHISPNNSDYSPAEITSHIHMKKAPVNITLNGESITSVNRLTSVEIAEGNAAYFDEFNRVLHVKMLLNDSEGCLDISLDEGRCYDAFKPFSEESIAGQLPYIYPPAAVPCVIQAIHYDRGGEGVAFHKNTKPQTAVYRDDSAGIDYVDDSLCVKALEKGEWLEYTISSAKEGIYDVTVEGSLNNAVIEVSIENSAARLINGKAALSIGTGQKALRIEVIDGMGDIRIVRIERRDGI